MQDNPRNRELYWCRMEDWGKWIVKWMEAGPAYTLFIDDIPVMCAGVGILRPGLGEAWMVLSTLFYKYRKECFIAVRDRLEMIIKGEKLKRVQALVLTDFPEAEHWLIHLGFENETPTKRGLRSFGPSGEDMLMFGRECK